MLQRKQLNFLLMAHRNMFAMGHEFGCFGGQSGRSRVALRRRVYECTHAKVKRPLRERTLIPKKSSEWR